MFTKYLTAIASAFSVAAPTYLFALLIGVRMRRRVNVASRIASQVAPHARRERFFLECARIALHAGRIWAVLVVLYGLALIYLFEPGVYLWWAHAVSRAFQGH